MTANGADQGGDAFNGNNSGLGYHWKMLAWSWRFDHEPGDEIEFGGLAGLLLLVGDDEAATGLEAGGDALLEGPGDGFHEGYLRRLTLLAVSRVRIWVMAMPLSMARRSGCGRP